MDDSELPLPSLERVFESSSDAVYAVDANQTVLFVNHAAAELLGVSREEAAGRHCFELLAGTDYDGRCICRAQCATISCARLGVAVNDYDVLAHPETAPRRWVNMGIVVTRVEGFEQPIAVHMARDLTARRELQPDADESDGSAASLTAREVEVLRLLASGATVRQIAQQFVVSPSTVRSHIENLMAKLGVHSRLQAVARASRLGVL